MRDDFDFFSFPAAECFFYNALVFEGIAGRWTPPGKSPTLKEIAFPSNPHFLGHETRFSIK